jgi:CheY-like chemotaxis protein
MPRATTSTSQTRSSNDPGHTILVVEDEVLIREPLAEYLRDCGYRVFEAVDTAEAKAILTAGTPINLVFTDVNMPGPENGLMLANWVRKHHPQIEVIVTSGVVNIAAKASDLRMHGAILVKPYRYEAVLQRIQTAIH